MTEAASAVSCRPACCLYNADWVKNNPVLVTAICLAVLGGIAGVMYTTDFNLTTQITIGAVAAAYTIAIPLLILASGYQMRKNAPLPTVAAHTTLLHRIPAPKPSRELTVEEKNYLQGDRRAMVLLCDSLGIKAEEHPVKGNMDPFLTSSSYKMVVILKEGHLTLCLRVKGSADKPFYIKITPEHIQGIADQFRYRIEAPSDFFEKVGSEDHKIFGLDSRSSEGLPASEVDSYLSFSQGVKDSLTTLRQGKHSLYQMV